MRSKAVRRLQHSRMSERAATGRSADLLIIGGGIHGCSAALQAAMRGLSVIVLEKDNVARHASGVNAGGVRRLGRNLLEVPISVRSMEIWHGIVDLLDDDCGFQSAPQIKLAENEEEMRVLSERAATLRVMGFDHEVELDRAQVREYLPQVADHVIGGLACLDDGFAQPFWTTIAFQRKAESLGVQFFQGVAATRIARDTGDWRVDTSEGRFSAPCLLIAAGAWSGILSGQLDEPVPIESIAPMMIVTSRLPHFCDAVVGAAGRPLSFKQMPNGTVVIGGGRLGRADAATNLSEIRFSQLQLTAETAMALFPIMANATIVRAWSGIEGCMPDGIPVIGRSVKHEGLYYSFGFSAHGFQMGPGVGELLAESIASGRDNELFGAFSIGRFGG